MTTANFAAMGTEASILLNLAETRHADDFVRLARSTVELFEARWSRFRPTSDISRINDNPEQPVLVHPSTIEAVGAAVDAWRATDGMFDPTIGSSLVAAGYDRTFAHLTSRVPPVGLAATALGADVIEIHHTASTIAVPQGVSLDLGGIGKGLAADRTVDALLDAGVDGALVNIGGDLRAEGTSVDDQGWVVLLDCPGSSDTRTCRISRGAVCTSSTVKRRWDTRDGDEHHLRTPETGHPTDTDVLSASVIGATAAACEVLATCAVAAGSGPGAESIADHDATGVLVTVGGSIIELPGFEVFR